MKVYEEHHTPARIDKICVRRKCDLCGLESKWGDWESVIYDVNETQLTVTVRSKVGHTWDACGASGTKIEVDLCPACFKGRLVPWLREQGAKIEEVEYDY